MKEIKPTQEEEEDSKLEPTYELDTQILPTNIIVLRGDIQAIIKKIKTLPEKKLKRYEEYASSNLSRQSFAVQEFFSQNKIEVFEVSCNLIYPEMIESIRTYIEREGRPFNFLESSEVLRQRRLQYINEQEEQKIQQLTSDSDALSIRKEQSQFDREKNALEIWQNLQHRQEELQSVRAMPLRKYLMENLLPVLAEGLLECCKVVPSDPVDYLSEYVFKHSHPPKTILD
jgi:adenylate kinase